MGTGRVSLVLLFSTIHWRNYLSSSEGSSTTSHGATLGTSLQRMNPNHNNVYLPWGTKGKDGASHMHCCLCRSKQCIWRPQNNCQLKEKIVLFHFVFVGHIHLSGSWPTQRGCHSSDLHITHLGYLDYGHSITRYLLEPCARHCVRKQFCQVTGVLTLTPENF